MSSKVSSNSNGRQRLNVSQAAKLLGKGEASIRRWIQQFGIPTSNEGGQNLLSSEMVDVLRQIKELRAQKLRAEDIELNVEDAIRDEQQKLNQDHSPGRNDEASDIARQMVADLTDAMAEHNDAIAQSIKSAVQQSAKMADRYAESQRELGRMEAMLQGLQFQLQEAEKQARLLPEKAQALQEREEQTKALNDQLGQTEKKLEKIKEEQANLSQQLEDERKTKSELSNEKRELRNLVEQLKHELKEVQGENQQLTAELEQERSKSWWNKLTQK